MTARIAVMALAASLSTPALADLAFTSKAPGLGIMALPALPEAPDGRSQTEACTHLFAEAITTPGGEDAKAKGWFVTAEAPLGNLTAVSFVASAMPATSGTCELLNGNVGIYDGGTLLALVYAADPDTLAVARISPFDGGLRILSGDLVPETSADLIRTGDAISVTVPAVVETVCNGAASVPLLEGLPIDQARARLMQSGWEPVPGDPGQQALGWAKDVAAAGVPEVEDCVGTGFAFCTFHYTNPVGDLWVVTVGEITESGGLPVVSSNGVTCK